MNRVSTIANTYFDFGKPPQTDTQATDTTTSYDGSMAATGENIPGTYGY